MAKYASDKKMVKGMLRSLLISSVNEMTVESLKRDYKKEEGMDVPYQKFGYPSFLDFLLDIPDTVQVRHGQNGYPTIVVPVVSDKAAHIEALVRKQKPPQTSKKRSFVGRRSAGVSSYTRSAWSNQDNYHSNYSDRNSCSGSSSGYRGNSNGYGYHSSNGGRPNYNSSGGKSYNDKAPYVPAVIQQAFSDLVGGYQQGITMSQLKEKLDPILRHHNYNRDISDIVSDLGHLAYVSQDRIYLAKSEGLRTPRVDQHVAPKTEEWSPQTPQVEPSESKVKFSVGKPRDVKPPEMEPPEIEPPEVKPPEMEPLDVKPPELKPPAEPAQGLLASSSIINGHLQNNLRKLISNCPDGIWCSQLLAIYKGMYNVDLNFRRLGFVSVVQLTAAIPEIFHSVRIDGSDWKLFDASKPLPKELVQQEMNMSNGTLDLDNSHHIPSIIQNNIQRIMTLFPTGVSSEKFQNLYQDTFNKELNLKELGFEDVTTFLMALNGPTVHLRFVNKRLLIYPSLQFGDLDPESTLLKSSKAVEPRLDSMYPAEVMGMYTTIRQQEIPANLRRHSTVEVIVAEVYNPHKFWVQLRGQETHVALEKLMNDMQVFYNKEGHNYVMPDLTVRLGQMCAAPYNSEWHRARITGIHNLVEVQLFFMDYGTWTRVKKTELRFLHQDFSILPGQAIRAYLAGLGPIEAKRFTSTCNFKFLDLVVDKPLIAIIAKIEPEKPTLHISLVDTLTEEDINIGQVLVDLGLAVSVPQDEEEAEEKVPEAPLEESVVEPQASPLPAGVSTKKGPPGFSKKEASSYSTSFATQEPLNLNAELLECSMPPNTQPVSSLELARQHCYWKIYQEMCVLMITNPSLAAYLLTQQLSNYPQFMNQPSLPNTNSHLNETPLLNTNSHLNETPLPNTNSHLEEPPMPNTYSYLNQDPSLNAYSHFNQIPSSNAYSHINQTPMASAYSHINQTPMPSAYSHINQTPMPSAYTHLNQTPAPSSYAPLFNQTPMPDVYSQLLHSPSPNNFAQLLTPPSLQSQNQIPHPNGYCQPSLSTLGSPVAEHFSANWLHSPYSNLTAPMGPPSALRADGYSPVESHETLRSSTPSLTKPSHLPKTSWEAPSHLTKDSWGEGQRDPLQPPNACQPTGDISSLESASNLDSYSHIQIVKIAGLTAHLIHLGKHVWMCLDEFVNVFTMFSGRHVILKILHAKSIPLKFLEINCSDQPDLFRHLDRSNIVGLPKQKPKDSIHLIDLMVIPKLLPILNIMDSDIVFGFIDAANKYCPSTNTT